MRPNCQIQHVPHRTRPKILQQCLQGIKPFLQRREDFYVCPMGQKMRFIRQEKRYTASGYEQTLSIYRTTRCEGCPLRGQYHKSKRIRQLDVNHTLDDYTARARELLTSELGLVHRSNRPIEPEAVFGQIKENGKFRRLRLKVLTGAKIEFGLKAIAHNLRKLALVVANSSFFTTVFVSNSYRKIVPRAENLKNPTPAAKTLLCGLNT